jgi:hypothetical protein
MPLDHIDFDRTTRHGSLLQSALNQLQNGRETLNDILAGMGHMIDSDGSQDAHYSTMAAKFGFPSLQAPSGAVARAAWNELNSMASKINTDASVSFVQAALLQAFAKFR